MTERSGGETPAGVGPSMQAREPSPPRRRIRAGLPGPRLLAEMAVIVFSVLLALVLNEWRQGQNRAATVASVLETVRSETEANLQEVERALGHHRSLVEQLQSGGLEMGRLDLRREPLDTTSAAAFVRDFREAARVRGAAADAPMTAVRLPDGRWEVSLPDGRVWVSIVGDTAVLRGTGGIVLRPPFLVDSAWETAQITQAAVHMDAAVVASMARARQLHRSVEGTVARVVDMLYGTATARAPSLLSALQDLVSFESGLARAYDDLLELLPPHD